MNYIRLKFCLGFSWMRIDNVRGDDFNIKTLNLMKTKPIGLSLSYNLKLPQVFYHHVNSCDTTHNCAKAPQMKEDKDMFCAIKTSFTIYTYLLKCLCIFCTKENCRLMVWVVLYTSIIAVHRMRKSLFSIVYVEMWNSETSDLFMINNISV